jgi:lysophospholipase L1-like esterase
VRRIALWWLLAAPLLPIILPQALYTRRTALRLPPAAGQPHGLAGAGFAGEPLRLLLVGESTVAGVGVGSLQAALPGQLAEALARRLQRPVQWRAWGENGITAGQASQRLLPGALAEPVDLALLVFGVNDTTGLSSLRQWQQPLRQMAWQLGQGGAQVAFSAVPPLEHFRALPWLLRQVLGARGRILDHSLRRLAAEVGAQHCAVELEFACEYLAEDGYHPSGSGYRVWAEGLAAQLRLDRSAR